MKRTIALAAGLLLLGACSGDKADEPRVPVVVPGPAAAWSAVTVNAGAQTVDVPHDVRADLIPLRAARAFDRPGPPADYGLDHPRAHFAYRPTSDAKPAVDVDVGDANFDRHFVYVQRRGSPTVYLVPSDTLRPALALVGMADKPPDD